MIFDVNLQLTFLADLLIKSAIVLVVGFVVVGLARRSAAAVRHRIWSLTFLSLLILPVISLGFPQVRFDILPAALLGSQPTSDNILVQDREALQNDAKPHEAIVANAGGDVPRGVQSRESASELHQSTSPGSSQKSLPIPFDSTQSRWVDSIDTLVPSLGA